MKLYIGCGKDIREGYINLDIAKLPGVDIVWDLSKLPLPFKDGEFDEILTINLFEHMDYVPLMKELHRVLTPGGKLVITVPHFTSYNNASDPTHRSIGFAVRTFCFFAKDNPLIDWTIRDYYFDYSFSKMETLQIVFSQNFPFNWVIEYLVNTHHNIQLGYEFTGLSRLFPAESVYTVLIK